MARLLRDEQLAIVWAIIEESTVKVRDRYTVTLYQHVGDVTKHETTVGEAPINVTHS